MEWGSGKLEKGEIPLHCILREVKEETCISLNIAKNKGNVVWAVNQSYQAGMYTYVVELPETYEYETPVKMDEGILDWKKIDWILHPKKYGCS